MRYCLLKIGGPITLAHRFKHFNGNNRIELALHIAVILQAYIRRTV